jgi:hypothetical protein
MEFKYTANRVSRMNYLSLSDDLNSVHNRLFGKSTHSSIDDVDFFENKEDRSC